MSDARLGHWHHSLSGAKFDFAVTVVRRLHEAGFVAYFAGGCVRDYLLGLVPSDFDIATSATPGQVRDLFGHRRTLMIGASFGVVCVLGRKDHDEGQVEVATFRKDGTYQDGRRPDAVTFSTPELDAQRRDFTINGLFFDPLEQRVLDFVGGQEDLENQRLRAIGDPYARFEEDRLRMLRAVRFAVKFDLAIEPATHSAIEAKASLLESVSAERIAMELRKMFALPSRTRALMELIDTNLLKYAIPVLDDAALPPHRTSVADSPLYHLVSKLQANASFSSSLAAVYWQLLSWSHRSKIEQTAICRTVVNALNDKLRLSKDEVDRFAFAIVNADTLAHSERLPWSTIQPILTHRAVSDALDLSEALALSGYGTVDSIAFCRERLAWPESILNPAPLLDGEDLKQLGLNPGPRFRELLAQARQCQLDGTLRTKEEAIAWAHGR